MSLTTNSTIDDAIAESDATGQPVALSTPTNHHILRSLIASRFPKHALEIGLAFGGSAVEILSDLAKLWQSYGTAFSHSAIDPLQESVWRNEGIRAVDRAGLSDHFQFYEEGSETTLPRLAAEGRLFDLIYVDGAHTFEHVIRDALYAIELLPVGGVVMFDDCRVPDIRKVLRYLSRNYRGFIEEMDLTPHRPNPSLLRRLAYRVGYSQARAFRRIAPGTRAWNAKFYNF